MSRKSLSVYFIDSGELAYEVDLFAGRSVSHVNINLRTHFSHQQAKVVQTGEDEVRQI